MSRVKYIYTKMIFSLIVFIQFEITKDGYFINFSTIGPNKILEDEAYRIMAKLPQVKAGEYLGKKVSVLYGLPISFRLN